MRRKEHPPQSVVLQDTTSSQARPQQTKGCRGSPSASLSRQRAAGARSQHHSADKGQQGRREHQDTLEPRRLSAPCMGGSGPHASLMTDILHSHHNARHARPAAILCKYRNNLLPERGDYRGRCLARGTWGPTLAIRLLGTCAPFVVFPAPERPRSTMLWSRLVPQSRWEEA